MRRLALGALALLFSTGALAGTIGITATGTASMPAEYLALGVTVHSKCYRKAGDAQAANAVLANEILAVMNRYVTDEAREKLKDVVTAVGGYFVRQTETVYRNNRTEVVCENGWRTAKYLTLKLLDVTSVAQVQDAILEVVDRSPETELSGEPQTWGEFSSPTPQLTEASERALEDRALKTAIQNARHELGQILEECTIRNPRLIRIQVPGQQVSPQAGRMERANQADQGDSSPFVFGEISTSVTRLFTYEYDRGMCPQ